jgi:hypothetical protein
MKTPREQLLAELIAHEDYAAFRARLLDHGLGEVRRRRHIRRTGQRLALAACLVVIAGLALVALRRPGSGPVKLPCDNVRSVSLQRGEIVATTGLMAARVKTEPGSSAQTGAEIVRTDPESRGPDRISDQQLLALFQGHPLALLSQGMSAKQLRFLDPNDEAVFLGN